MPNMIVRKSGNTSANSTALAARVHREKIFITHLKCSTFPSAFQGCLKAGYRFCSSILTVRSDFGAASFPIGRSVSMDGSGILMRFEVSTARRYAACSPDHRRCRLDFAAASTIPVEFRQYLYTYQYLEYRTTRH